jgi:hypothetical protein
MFWISVIGCRLIVTYYHYDHVEEGCWCDWLRHYCLIIIIIISIIHYAYIIIMMMMIMWRRVV